MSENTCTCQQAVFTSVRTPMGEGYRIIAASPGLRPEERQAITRFSPSHNGLCAEGGEGDTSAAPGMAFYALPTGRLCVALSCTAGAEHTGRGGQRIYTHNVVIDADELSKWGYNPFRIVRAMIEAGLMNPQLKPPTVLEELELARDSIAPSISRFAPRPAIDAPCCGQVLDCLFDDRKVILALDDGWSDTLETLLMGIPGPMRQRVSFASGLQFSASRSHDLTLLSDPKGTVRNKLAGQPVEYVAPGDTDGRPRSGSSWVGFVERHWSSGDFEQLAARTSRPFKDFTAPARERIGQLFTHVDDIPNRDTDRLLATAATYLVPEGPAVEPELVDELLQTTKTKVVRALGRSPWSQTKEHWPLLLRQLTGSPRASAFASGIVEAVVRDLMVSHPRDAAAAVYELATAQLPENYAEDCAELIEQALGRFADWAYGQPADKLDGLAFALERWRGVRPDSPAIERLTRRCETVENELSSSGSRSG